MLELQTTTFIAPSGTEYTIREQNGQDEEILTNLAEVKRSMNLSNFIQAILVKSSIKPGKYTIEEVMDIPYLDRQCILIHSRIFSLGNILEFTYKWPKPDGKLQEFEYEQDLNEYLLDYSKREDITEEDLKAKPEAIPFYPIPVIPGEYIESVLSNGTKIRFKPLNGHSEIYITRLQENERSRNTELLARLPEMEIDGKWERIYNFSLLSARMMKEFRKVVESYDPSYAPEVEVINPNTDDRDKVTLMAIPSFFFPGEDA